MRLDHLLSKESTPGARGVCPRRSGALPRRSLAIRRPRPESDPSAPRAHEAPPGRVEAGQALFRFEGVAPARSRAGVRVSRPRQRDDVRCGSSSPPEAPGRSRPFGAPQRPLENCIASTSIKYSQAMKSQRWMPWRQMPMKDVGGCEKPRGAVYQALIRGYPNGETRLGSCPVTPA